MSRARGAAITVAALVAVAATAAIALHPSPTSPEASSGAATAGRGAGTQKPAATPSDAIGGPLLASHGILVHYPATGARKLPKIPASAWVLADAGTGQVLAARDPHGLFPPASTLKVLTAISLIPALDPDMMVTASRRATSVEPNIVGLARGHSYRVADLFRALLMISANDAAVALTQATGSYSHGISLMNAEARWLHADDVVARNPNGLPARGQVVSAYDEALIARQALTLPDFMRYDSTLSARFHIKKKKWVGLVNQNNLLINYPGGLGGKIGWTEKARATYIGMARRHGVTLIVTILHCRPLAEIKAGEKLLSWGFKMDHKVTPVGTLVPPRSIPNPAG
ncbi:MAG TPA: D-alanyl-D-alanine carboxypeptidase [Streptosporangiaceae bacterium]|jgi:D-alanyl-D-alanine carboxypeptidase (penicillin-binding protein 5/6)|nr:D-alanyl-D-alanine carboxypeptidase [Streptosporangiaceae bacterium]